MNGVAKALLAITFNVCLISSQAPNSQSHSKTFSQIEANNGRLQAVIDKSERHYKQGEAYLKDKNFNAARAEFDKAVNAILESGFDVRDNPRLQTYYLQLVERIYQIEIPGQALSSSSASTQGETLRNQKFEPSPLDELSRLASGYDYKSPLSSEPCDQNYADRINLRGFKLGMNVEEVRRRIPSIKLGAQNNLGRREASAVIHRERGSPSELSGVRVVFFTFIDGRTSYIAISYNDSVKWGSLEEFAARTAEALKIPPRWESYSVGDNPQLRLICGEIQLSAGFVYPYSRSLPMLFLADTSAHREYVKREAAAAERRRLEEEKRRRTFKP